MQTEEREILLDDVLSVTEKFSDGIHERYVGGDITREEYLELVKELIAFSDLCKRLLCALLTYS